MSEIAKPLLPPTRNVCGGNDKKGNSIFSNPLLSKQLMADEVTYKSTPKTKVIGDYTLGAALGKGAYGKVREALNNKDNRLYAIKILKKQHLKRIPFAEETLKREIDILKKIHHPNCVEYSTHFKDENDNLFIVTNYIGGGSLARLILKAPNGILPVSQARSLFSQLLNALEHLHSLNIVHLDIKPDNLILTPQGQLKLTDFGSALDLTEAKKCTGCPAFQPPEIASGNQQAPTFKTDIWQAGLTLFMMVVGRYPFEGKNLPELVDNISVCKFAIPSTIEASLSDLLHRILNRDPEKRLSIQQIRSHPWMTCQLPEENPILPIPSHTLFPKQAYLMSNRACNCALV